MTWMETIRETLRKRYENKTVNEQDPFVQKLKAYLKQQDYSKQLVRYTVMDVLALDPDLLDFVKAVVLENRVDPAALCCGNCFTMEELLKMKCYPPVAAALLFQLFRDDPPAALQVLMMSDQVSMGSAEELGVEDESAYE